MPEIRIVFYKEEDGEVPVLEWLRHLLENPTEKLIVHMLSGAVFSYGASSDSIRISLRTK